MCLIFLTFSNLNKTNYGNTRYDMCLNPTNLNNINYYYNVCDMYLTPQTRTKLITIIEHIDNCCYKKYRYQ